MPKRREGGDIGDVYYCAWEKTKDGRYVGWEKKHPKLRVEVATKDELLPKLGDVVGEYYSDFEAAIEFDPPIDIKQGYEKLFSDDLVRVTWNSGFNFRPTRDTAYVGGRCKRCGGGIGARTEFPLIVDDIDPNTDGAFSAPSNEPPPCHGNPGYRIVVSEGFLKILTADERAQFDVLRVEFERKHRKSFFEIIPKHLIPTVAIRGLEVNGWRCDECGRRSFAR